MWPDLPNRLHNITSESLLPEAIKLSGDNRDVIRKMADCDCSMAELDIYFFFCARLGGKKKFWKTNGAKWKQEIDLWEMIFHRHLA